ncbi:MAG: RNA polymerase sigma factor, partial [Micromonosporaceae bacterium]
MGTQEEPSRTDPVVAIYDDALPQVYGYLLPRCGNAAVAEDLTAETFMAAVDAARRRNAPEINVAWLVGVARHKLVDHWRRLAREQRTLAIAELPGQGIDDPWEGWIDAEAAHMALSRLSAHHRAALA